MFVFVMRANKFKYRVEAVIRAKTIYNGDGSVLMESESLCPVVLEGDDVEAIFVELGKIGKIINSNGEGKMLGGSALVCMSEFKERADVWSN